MRNRSPKTKKRRHRDHNLEVYLLKEDKLDTKG